LSRSLRTVVAHGVSALGVYQPLETLAGQLRGGFILAFHNLGSEAFSELIQSLSPDEPVHLAELVDRLRHGKSTNGIFAITVDDGVGETVRALSSVATQRNWPITFFLPTAYLDTRDGMPFQWLDTVLPRLPRTRLELRSGLVDLSTESARRRFERRVRARMYSQPAEDYSKLIEELVCYAVSHGRLSREHDAPPRPISWDEVAALAAHPAVRFESHGVTHIAAAALPPEQLERELRESRERIHTHTGRAGRHFAYPFGSPDSIGPIAPSLVAKYYDSGVTMTRRRVRNRDRFLLPRIPLYAGDSTTIARLKVLSA